MLRLLKKKKKDYATKQLVMILHFFLILLNIFLFFLQFIISNDFVLKPLSFIRINLRLLLHA